MDAVVIDMGSRPRSSLASFIVPSGDEPGAGDTPSLDTPGPPALATPDQESCPGSITVEGTPGDRATFSMLVDTFMACFSSTVQRASFLMDAIKIHVPAGEGPVTFAAMDSSHVCLMKAILQLGTRAPRAFELTLRCADVLRILAAVKATKPRTVAGSFSPDGFSIGGFTVNACHEPTLDETEEALVLTFPDEMRGRMTVRDAVLVEAFMQHLKNAMIVDDVFDLHFTAGGVSISAGDDDASYAHAITRAGDPAGDGSSMSPASGCFSSRFVENAIKPGPLFPKVKALAGRSVTLETGHDVPLLVSERLPWLSGETWFLIAPRVKEDDDDEDDDVDDINAAIDSLDQDENDIESIEDAIEAIEATGEP